MRGPNPAPDQQVAMTLTDTEDVPEGTSTGHGDPSQDGARAASPSFGAMSGWAMRLPWLGPALLTLAVGWYPAGRTELAREGLASWPLATRPVPIGKLPA